MVRSLVVPTCNVCCKPCTSPVLFDAPCLANVVISCCVLPVSACQNSPLGTDLAWSQVIVITGDNKLTAEAICRKVGVFAADEDLKGKSITGVEFMKLPLDKRRSMLQGHAGACFSRAEPRHKQVSGQDTSSHTFVCGFGYVGGSSGVCLYACLFFVVLTRHCLRSISNLQDSGSRLSSPSQGLLPVPRQSV